MHRATVQPRRSVEKLTIQERDIRSSVEPVDEQELKRQRTDPSLFNKASTMPHEYKSVEKEEVVDIKAPAGVQGETPKSIDKEGDS